LSNKEWAQELGQKALKQDEQYQIHVKAKNSAYGDALRNQIAGSKQR